MLRAASDPLEGNRICPFCRSAEPLGDREPLWPLNWRCPSCRAALPQVNEFVQLAPALDATNDGFDLENFDLLPGLEEDYFWFVSRNELISWLVRRHAGGARRVLEIGCGTGFVLYALRQALPDASIAGSELHSRGLMTARRRHGAAVELIQMDARDSGLRSALDLVGAFDVLEHIVEDEAVLAEVARMLRPGAVFIAAVPQHPWMWGTPDDLAHHQRRYRVGELARKARAAGLDPIYQTSHIALAFPLMVASRVLRSKAARPRTLRQQIRAEYDISPTTNKALLSIARMEHMLRRMGVRFMFGGSQIVVARRPAR